MGLTYKEEVSWVSEVSALCSGQAAGAAAAELGRALNVPDSESGIS